MRYSRTGIIAVLLAAEVFIGGAIIWSLRGGHPVWTAQAASVNRMSEQAHLDAGRAPHVVIDDPDTRVVVTASADGLVHVTDHTHRIGWFFGAADAPLKVTRTSDGVDIRRGDGRTHGSIGVIGFDFQRTEVAVPAGAFIDIERCSGATLSGLAGPLAVHSVDGSIRGKDLRVTGGTIANDDGSIHLAFADTNLDVHTKDGDGDVQTYRVGSGGGSLQVSTQDGSIHIHTNGAE
jgi:hypothetical protein